MTYHNVSWYQSLRVVPPADGDHRRTVPLRHAETKPEQPGNERCMQGSGRPIPEDTFLHLGYELYLDLWCVCSRMQRPARIDDP